MTYTETLDRLASKLDGFDGDDVWCSVCDRAYSTNGTQWAGGCAHRSQTVTVAKARADLELARRWQS